MRLLHDLVHWSGLGALQDNPILIRTWESEPIFKTNLEKEIKANHFIKNVLNCRRERILSYLLDDGFKGAVMFAPENVFYFTGFWGESIAMCTSEGIKLFVPQLEVSRAERESFDCEIFSTQRGDDSTISLYPYLSNSKFCSDCNDFKTIDSIHKKVGKKSFICDSQPFLIVRSVKGEEEISMIKKSSEIIDRLYQVCVEEIKVNLSEKDLQAKLVCEAMNRGGTFPCYPFTLSPFIIASGPNGALPHAEVSDRSFCKGDLVVVDLTIRYRGYVSDATRTFALGGLSDEKTKVYDIVKKSQEAGLFAAKSRVKGHEIDLVCRKLIHEYGYGQNFIHSTGHGVGLQVHEKPWIRPNDNEPLQENMVITIEPGIYVKSKFGVRIEDTVVIKGNNSHNNDVLTKFTKELIVIN